MMVWDVITKTHEVLAHTGFMAPHGLVTYDDGELRLPDEIDLPLITLGGTVDAAFQQALADAIDPLGNLDKDQVGVRHRPLGHRSATIPTIRCCATPRSDRTTAVVRAGEFRRPWAYPTTSLMRRRRSGPALADADRALRREPAGEPGRGPAAGRLTRCSGPAPTRRAPGRTRCSSVPAHPWTRRCDASTRSRRPRAPPTCSTRPPADPARAHVSPLGDPVPFSAYLIGQLANPTGYDTQFNLDSDRAYAYLTWDWIRGDTVAHSDTGFPFDKPEVAPQGEMQEGPDPASEWDATGSSQLELHYVDPPTAPLLGPSPRGRRRQQPAKQPEAPR